MRWLQSEGEQRKCEYCGDYYYRFTPLRSGRNYDVCSRECGSQRSQQVKRMKKNGGRVSGVSGGRVYIWKHLSLPREPDPLDVSQFIKMNQGTRVAIDC